ncbi:medium chain dehydrogenase/reductase family protein [Pantoea brenneri]|uniref:medium chain dehydrogenase/reductase family protein n=1 Tax=Pantoea brenneri TaxID=472694 RepID=UPI00289AF65A|nr:medium chain dehydrogenase/reductase family protein [Pantoea brenneri]
MSYLPTTYKTAELANGIVRNATKKFPRHTLNENSVVIRPDYIGICRADVKEIIGSRDVPSDRGPLFGHELVGTVVFGGTSSGFQEGELVTFNPNITPDRTTGFAEYVFINGSAEQLDQAVIRVPQQDIIHHIWMPEPMACIVHATQKLLTLTEATDLQGKKVGIIGAGCSGTMFAMYAKHLGASVAIFNRGKMRREFAHEKQLLCEDEIFALDNAKDHAGEFDIVMVVSTIVSQDILEMAADLTASNGTVLIYGGTREGDKFLTTGVDIDVIRRKELIRETEYQGQALRICGAYGCYKEDYEESFRLHATYPQQFPLESLVSTVIEFDDFADLVMRVAAGEHDYPGKVVVRINLE